MKTELKMFGLWAVFAAAYGSVAGASALLTGSECAGCVMGSIAFLLTGSLAYDAAKRWAAR